MSAELDNIVFRFQASMALISGVTLYYYLKKFYQLQQTYYFIKDENFNDVKDIINQNDIKVFGRYKISKQYFRVNRLLVQGYINSLKENEKDENFVNFQTYVSLYKDIHDYYGVFDKNKIDYYVPPKLQLKDFDDPTQMINCTTTKKDINNLYTLCEQVQTKPYSAFKVFGLGLLNLLTAILGRSRQLTILQEKSDTFGIKSNLPCFMLADIVINKKSGQIHLRSSEFVEKSPEALKNLLKKKFVPLTICLVLLSITTAYFSKKAISYLWNKYQDYRDYVEMKKTIQQMEKQTFAIQDVHKCIICFDSVRSTILYPCKHVVICLECYKELKKQYLKERCPICRSEIERIQMIAFKST